MEASSERAEPELNEADNAMLGSPITLHKVIEGVELIVC